MDDQIAGPWQQSSYSGGNGQCVQVAVRIDGGRLVRDSKLGDASPVLAVPAAAMAVLLDGIRADQF